MKNKVLVSFTTFMNDDWHQTVADLAKLGVTEFALFLTGVDAESERWQILKEIKATIPDAKILFVHLRPDVTPKEIDFLIDEFGTELFNLHPLREYPLVYDYDRFKSQILIENSGPANRDGLKPSDVDSFGGICLDLSHLKNSELLFPSVYKITVETMSKLPVLANHISAISDEPIHYPNHRTCYDQHRFNDLSQFDYLKQFPKQYFGQYLALELMNPISEQLEAKKYVEGIIKLKAES